MTNNTALPTAGDDYTFETYEGVDFCTAPRRMPVKRLDGSQGYGYVFPRTAEDFPRCDWTCYRCHGQNTGLTTVKTVEKVDRVIHFADNSIEVFSVTGRRAVHVAPSGDACF